MHPPNFDFNPAPHGPGQTHRQPSARVQAAFTGAAPHAAVFPNNTIIVSASSRENGSFGVTTPRTPLQPMVAINRRAHDNADGHRDVRMEQTAIHELVVHAQYDSRHQGTTAAHDHRTMFLAPQRAQPNSFLTAVRSQIRAHAGNLAEQQVVIAEYERDVTSEIEDPANQAGLSHQQLTGARTFHRNRVNSMTDAILPVPTRQHSW
jgi:hypothetical protein